MPSLRTGSLAAKAGVNIETIRYYERRGLILQPERTASGYRIFDEEDLKRLRFIKEAQALGRILQAVDDRGTRTLSRTRTTS